MKYDHFMKQKGSKRVDRIWGYRPGLQDIEPPLLILTAGYSRWSKGDYYMRTLSRIFTVELVCAGNAELVQGDRKYIIQEGEVYLLRRNVSHRYTTGPAGFLLKRFVTIDGPGVDHLLRIMNLWGRDHIWLRSPRKFALLLKHAAIMLAEIPSDMDISCSSLAYRILLELSHSVRPTLPAVIEKALEYMQQNLHRSLSTGELCDFLGISQTHFNRLFTHHMQCSPIGYFLQQRLKWAAHMVSHTSLSIKEIAVITGYDDPLYFSARFKKQFGISPKNYRYSLVDLSQRRM